MKGIPSFIAILIFIWLITGNVSAGGKGNTTIQSFKKAKKILLNQIYNDHRITFYCGCPFTDDKKIIPSDRYKPKKPTKRSKRIEWEHIVPASDFGRSFKEWRKGHPECVTKKGKRFKGRNCARKVSKRFRYMDSDLYNLVPAVGEINGLRSTYRFGMIASEKRVLHNIFPKRMLQK
jgi:deoxyribonuclease-1